ncbi:LuxR C-terminal-related transcriptional regulator [Paenibacillus cymbidii]|uniref:LuxR C-terminal-related transcriptional regulator n=1 Tax=Paenibacillus cymbidii TaxID=1639034 RepID=UPI001081D98A|nr:LuxR C-terminal-related transcriptional regulator [Paenibacillus cymbidii]
MQRMKPGSSSADCIPPRRCLDLMNRESYRPLLALIAPTGYGKTALLQKWALSPGVDGIVVRLLLDEGDNEPGRLFARLLTELLSSKGEARTVTSDTPVRRILDEIADTLQSAETEGWILLFDRYEAIAEPSVHAAFESLILHAGPNVRIRIASREPLPFYPNLHVLYPGPFVLTQEHLRLNAEETGQFVRNRTRRPLAAADLDRLDRLAKGWPLALERYVSLLDGSRAELIDEQAAIAALAAEMHVFLLDHVLLQLPEELQRFMQRTSLPDFFDYELGVLLNENAPAGEMIERLLRKNMFLTQDNNGFYRYHPLVLQFLRTRLHQTASAADIAGLHVQISRWSERSGSLAEAAQHALQVPDYERAAALLLADVAATVVCPAPALIRLMEQFPAAELNRRPSLAMFYAWILTAEHRIAAAETVLNQLEPHLTEETVVFAPTGENLRGYLATIRSRIHLMRRDSERGIALMHEAASLLNGPGYLYAHANLFDPCGSSLLRSSVGYWGAIDQSIEIYGYAEPLWSGVNQGLGIIHTLLGECYYERNQLIRAEQSLLSGRRIGIDLQNTGIVLPASIALIQLKWFRGEHQAAQILLEETRRLIPLQIGDKGQAVLDACQAQLHMKAGETNRVNRWRQLAAPGADTSLDIGRMFEYVTLIRSCRFLDQYRQGIAFGERLLHVAEAWYLHYYVAEINMLLALLYEGSGDRGTALLRLENATEIGRKETYMRLFLNDWEDVEPLLQLLEKTLQLRKPSTLPETAAYLKQLSRLYNEQELFANKDRFAEQKLTAKEYKVLQALIAGKSNAVVAAELSIRLETVKTHCKNIYRKLGLKSRKSVVQMFAAMDKG